MVFGGPTEQHTFDQNFGGPPPLNTSGTNIRKFNFFLLYFLSKCYVKQLQSHVDLFVWKWNYLLFLCLHCILWRSIFISRILENRTDSDLFPKIFTDSDQKWFRPECIWRCVKILVFYVPHYLLLFITFLNSFLEIFQFGVLCLAFFFWKISWI